MAGISSKSKTMLLLVVFAAFLAVPGEVNKFAVLASNTFSTTMSVMSMAFP